MTAYVAATLHNLLLRRFAPPPPARPAPARSQRALRVPDAAETMPMLFRSEGFAEDLLDPTDRDGRTAF